MRRHPIAGPVHPRPVMSLKDMFRAFPTRVVDARGKKITKLTVRCGVYPPFLDHVPSYFPQETMDFPPWFFGGNPMVSGVFFVHLQGICENRRAPIKAISSGHPTS